jgi:hypothetical protein
MGLVFLTGTISASADVVLDWNEKALATVLAAKQSLFLQTRSMTMVHVAMFEAVNAIQQRYTPYKAQIPASATASSEAAAAAAAHAILARLYPNQQDALGAAYAASLAQLPDGEGKAVGIALGEKVARQILAWRADDGSTAPNTYKPSTAPGVYVPTALPVGTEQPRVTPWLMQSSAQFRLAPPPALASQEWARDYNEVKDWGGKTSAKRTAEQANIARFWLAVWPRVGIRSCGNSRLLNLGASLRMCGFSPWSIWPRRMRSFPYLTPSTPTISGAQSLPSVMAKATAMMQPVPTPYGLH